VVRANGYGLSIRRLLLAVAAVASLGGLMDVAAVTPASAQSFTYNPLPPRAKPPKVANDNQMLVQATEVDYDYNN
jgi:LPS-assembly protein